MRNIQMSKEQVFSGESFGSYNATMGATFNHSYLDEKIDTRICILIVDDDVDISESLSVILQMEDDNYHIKTAININQAEKLLDTFRPDIALLDIKLGHESGLELLTALKIKVENIYCIMMTAFREAEYAVSAVKNGADDYLHKPVSADKLISTIARAAVHQRINKERVRAENRFKAVFEQTFQWLILTNDTGCVLEVNQVALSFSKINASDVYGKPLYDAPWWNTNKEFRGFMLQALEGRFVRSEFEVKSFNNDSVTMDVSIKPIKDGDGQLEMLVVECRDISERKKAELEIKQINEHLEEKVEARTAELHKSMLHAEQANRAKSDFLSRMSHELRTPLNAILGFAQLIELSEEDLPENVNSSVAEIMTAGGLLLKLIEEILDLSKVEKGLLDCSLEPVDLNELLHECLTLMGPVAANKAIEIEYSAGPDSYTVMANALRLKQIVLNLLSNAVKYNSDHGHIQLIVRIEEQKVILIVKDTGEGLQPNQMKKLFKPFERLNDDPNIEGAGIGLVISKALVEQMGGDIGVKSVYGEGSEFWISLNLINV